MNKAETFQQFLATQSVSVPIIDFVINFAFTAVIAHILGKIYSKYGRSISNRNVFADNFVLIAVTTMTIITVVKSSLALSLGLVGALSIVRFRAAIKEPEELGYLFLCIAFGLGFGANQRNIMLVAFVLVIAVIVVKHKIGGGLDTKSINLSVISQNAGSFDLETVTSAIGGFCRSVDLKRLDTKGSLLDASFNIELKEANQLQALTSRLQEIDPSVQISFIDTKIAL